MTEESGPPVDDREALDFEIRTTRDIQAKLIPKKIPRIRGYQLSAYYRPCKQISGDYFDFIELDRKRYGILVADVSGKGLSAGFIMAQVRTFLHNNLHVLGSPCLTAVSLNDYLRKTIPHGMFVTMFYYVLHVPTGQVVAVNCGHTPMMWYQTLSGSVKLIGQEGMALGIANRSIFQNGIHESKLNLARDDSIILYTDGVTEAMNAQNEEFGLDRLADVLTRHGRETARKTLEWVLREVYRFTGTTNLDDDLTMVSLKRVGLSADRTAPARKSGGTRLITVREAARLAGTSEEVIREAIANRHIRCRFVENIGDHLVVEEDALRMNPETPGDAPRKPRVLLVSEGSPFTDILSLELRRHKNLQSKAAGVSSDAVKTAADFDPAVVLFEVNDLNSRVRQVLSDLKQACPVAEIMTYTDHPDLVQKDPDAANFFRLLGVKQHFDKQAGTRPLLAALSAKIKSLQTGPPGPG